MNRKKLGMEIEKLQLGINSEKIELEQQLCLKELHGLFESLVGRFESNPIRLEQLELEREEDSERVKFA